MERLPRKKEYLGTFLGRYASSKDGQHLLQGSLGEVDSNISIFWLRFAHGQANNPASRKAEIEATNKTH